MPTMYFLEVENVSRYYNAGKVNVEEAARGIIAAGGRESVQRKDGYTHHTVYLVNKDHDRHLSWDEYDDGSIRNVHSTDDDGPLYTYGN